MQLVNNILSSPAFIAVKDNLIKAMAPLQNKVAAVAIAIFAVGIIIAKHFFFKAEKSEIGNLTDPMKKITIPVMKKDTKAKSDQLTPDGKKLKGLTVDRPRLPTRGLPARKPRQRPAITN
jgi:hypothetical protein